MSGFSRRRLLQTGLAGGGALLAGDLLAACGSSASNSQFSSAAAQKPLDAGPPRRGGVLRHGVSGGGNKDTLDPHNGPSGPDYARAMALYETPWMPSPRYQIENYLVEDYTFNSDATVWDVRLRGGIEFHNGKTLSADDLIFTIERILSPKEASPASGQISFIDPKRIRKLDERTVRFTLKSGFVPFTEALATFIFVVPVGFDPENPVGTGPFKYESFEPGVQSRFVRFENYWRDGHPYLDALEIIDFPDENSRLNALIAKEIDVLDGLPYTLAPSVLHNSEIHVQSNKDAAFFALGMRADVAPFDDVRVRQAIRLVVDRPKMVVGTVLGAGEVANDLYAPQDPFFASELPQREQDLDRAKFLLKSAGHSDLRLDLTTSNLLDGMISSAALFAAQAKAAGIQVSLNDVGSEVYFGPQYLEWPFAVNIPATANFLVTASQNDGPTSSMNTTHFHDPEFDKLYREAIVETNDLRRKQMVLEMQRIQWERGTFVIWGYVDVLDASRHVGGAVPEIGGLPYYHYGNLWLTDTV